MIYNYDCFDISQYKKLERGNVRSGFLGKSVFFVRETTRDNCTSHRNATNYDSLIEDALTESKRVVDVKYNNKHLSLTKPHRDAIVYKMHGDKSNPDEAILIKDDYEKYYRDHAQFITALSGDLISKTFLFVGFSFSDPNIDYILSSVCLKL